MSGAAVDWAATFTHPRVTDAAHEVLTAIARCIPEGETTTPLIGMSAIAREAHVDRRTVWTWLPVLVEIGVVRVVDGGQGRKARYTLVHIDGVAPAIAVPLPLRADLQAVPPRPVVALPLFDDPPIGRSVSDELVIRPAAPITSYTSWAARAITRITSWLVATITSYTSWLFVRSKSEELVIRTCDPCDPDRRESEELVIATCDPCDPDRRESEELVIATCDPCDPPRAIDAVLTTARDVPPLLRTTTTTAAAPPGDPPRPRAVESPPCRSLGTAHAWCRGRQHVPMNFHREERRRLARAPGETDADLDARLFARYAEILAAIPDTEEIRDKNEFEFWKRVLRSVPKVAGAHAPSPGPRRRPDIPHTRPCPHEPPCAQGDTAACIDREMAEWQPKREQSG